jgi:hypothetical protein
MHVSAAMLAPVFVIRMLTRSNRSQRYRVGRAADQQHTRVGFGRPLDPLMGPPNGVYRTFSSATLLLNLYHY